MSEHLTLGEYLKSAPHVSVSGEHRYYKNVWLYALREDIHLITPFLTVSVAATVPSAWREEQSSPWFTWLLFRGLSLSLSHWTLGVHLIRDKCDRGCGERKKQWIVWIEESDERAEREKVYSHHLCLCLYDMCICVFNSPLEARVRESPLKWRMCQWILNRQVREGERDCIWVETVYSPLSLSHLRRERTHLISILLHCNKADAIFCKFCGWKFASTLSLPLSLCRRIPSAI